MVYNYDSIGSEEYGAYLALSSSSFSNGITLGFDCSMSTFFSSSPIRFKADERSPFLNSPASEGGQDSSLDIDSTVKLGKFRLESDSDPRISLVTRNADERATNKPTITAQI
ncbi:Phosphatidylinositol/phosphatidylcholine transfer protein SFH8 [Senna tora]|uniref:Phosphatidylinositol/phosphatidylcholine transfer protein SFH8 n=1 Tax=Senna tora TaxID=362788 RepID=A0A834WN66_9FABA|nr:Phosphatidylinositol/phosphatidylcholine transfer protein SFH8 [Senna tora]